MGGLGTTYDVHLRFIGKRVVDFLSVLIELFSLGVMAESLRAKRDRKSAILLQHGQFDPKFQVEGVATHQAFMHVYLGQWMPYYFAANSFHTKKLCFKRSAILDGNRPFCIFEPPLGA